MFRQEGNRIIFHYDAEELWVEPWGEDAVRVRATKQAIMPEKNWALIRQPEVKDVVVNITADGA